MKKNKIKKDSEKESNLKIFFKDAGNYIKVKYPYLLLAFLSFIASQCLIDSHRLINGIKSIHLNHFSYTNLIDNLIDDKLFSVSMKIGVAANHFTYALLCIITLSQIFIYYNNFNSLINNYLK